VSYLNDPYQQYISKKASSKSENNQFLSPDSIKANQRATKLLLDVKEYGIFSNIDNQSNNGDKNNGLLTPPNSDTNINTSIPNTNSNSTNSSNTKNGLLAPPTPNTIKNTSFADIDDTNKEENSFDTIKAKKHSSFINPLLDMKFDVGGIFGDDDKDGEDLFGAMLSKYDSLEAKLTEENNVNSEKVDEEINKPIEDLKKENRLSQDTIKLKHSSTIKGDTSSNNLTISTDKHISQDTIKLIRENSKKIGSFDNQLVENLNAQPSIVADKEYLGESEEENSGFNPDIYKEDDKISYSFSNDWNNTWGSDTEKNEASSIKSSQSKISAFSSFTLKSSKKLGKMTKNFYKKITKHKHHNQFPKSPLDIPSSYNEKERAFEEMIFRDDTITISLSNPNGSLTSTFADKTFPLNENIDENQDDNDTEVENENAFADNSFNTVNGCEDETLSSKKKRHRQGINFEEALKEGNEFRISLANID